MPYVSKISRFMAHVFTCGANKVIFVFVVGRKCLLMTFQF